MGLTLSESIALGVEGGPVLFPTLSSLRTRLVAGVACIASTSWTDQSARGIVYASGTWSNVTDGGLPAVQLNGTSDGLAAQGGEVLNTLLSAMNAFAVVVIWKNANTANNTAGAGNGYNEPMIMCENNGVFYPVFGNNSQVGGGAGGGHDVLVADPGGYNYYESLLTTASSGTFSFQVGTAGTPSVNTGWGGMGGAGAQQMRIGSNYNNTKHTKGNIREIIICNALSPTELTNLRLYAKYTWGAGL